MTKIFFPYKDKPTQFSFKFKEPIRFPFYVNDLVYLWEVDAHGITLYLHNHKISSKTPVIRDILLEDSGITMYLVNEKTGTSKHILIEFAKIGKGIHTLGLLDPFTLGDIDAFTLGDISTCFADWMMMGQSIAKIKSNNMFHGIPDVKMQLKSDAVVSYDKKIYTGNLHEQIGIVGLKKIRNTTLGELDPYTLNDIDSMLSSFRLFENIPAYLVKEIKIGHKNSLVNNVASPNFALTASGSNIDIYIANSPNISLNRNMYFMDLDNLYLGLTNNRAQISTIPYVSPLAALSWNEISAISKAGNAPSMFSIGDEKDIVVNGETLTAVIVGLDHDDKTDGTGKAGITFGLKHLMSDIRQMESEKTNANGFYTELLDYLDNNLYNNIPDDLYDTIVPVNKKTSVGNQSTTIETEKNMYLFLFSEVEILGTTYWSVKGEGTQYEYFKAKENRIKQLANGDGEPAYWWTRSPREDNSMSYAVIRPDGDNASRTANSTAGICFGFCI